MLCTRFGTLGRCGRAAGTDCLLPSSIILPAIAVAALCNVYALYQIIALWSRISREAESEWEGSGANSVRTLGACLITYLLIALAASAIGFIGAYKRIPSYVRLFLQFAFGDFALYALSLIIVAFIGYRPSKWRESVCDELGTQPDILRSFSDAGFNLESCESWIENFVIGSLVVLSAGLLMKLQFTLAISAFYTSLARSTGHPTSVFPSSTSRSHRQSVSRSSRHIHLGPTRTDSQLPPYSDAPSVAIYAPSPDGDVLGLKTLSSHEQPKRRS